MNYGDRQDRAEFLLKTLRSKPDQSKIGYIDSITKRKYSIADLIKEFENQTELARELLAVAGLVLPALAYRNQEKK